MLDTNILSELMRATPAPSVVAWLDSQPTVSIWTTSVSVFEVRSGLSILPAGRRKNGLVKAFEAIVETGLRGRVLSLDERAATCAADIFAEAKRSGRPIDFRDLMIAGIVAANRATLATRNTKHFESALVATVNPWAV